MGIANLLGRNRSWRRGPTLPSAHDDLGRRLDGSLLPGPEIPLFFWNALGTRLGAGSDATFQTGNFGDMASATIVEWLADRRVAYTSDDQGGPRLLAIGSILHRACDGDVVWGSGLKGSAAYLSNGTDIDVRAVRGPITYDFLKRRGVDVSRVTHLFDPAVLCAQLLEDALRDERAAPKRPFAIVPHFRELHQFEMANRRHADAIVSPDGSLLSIARKLVRAERVLSSSLHGIIVAEALGVPAVWIRPRTAESELKFFDYYYSTERYEVVRCDTLEDAIRTEPMPPPRFDLEAMRASFPRDRLGDLAKQ